jgi:cytidine deaminase
MRTMRAADWARLTEAARAARAHAHAPYSRYAVGAALRTASGGVYVGCNVENATYGATLCAERAAVAAMVAAGDREPIACVVVTAGPEPGAPCGICRQVLAEFAGDMKILLVAENDSSRANRDGKGGRANRGEARVVAKKSLRLATLLPHAFRFRAPPRAPTPSRAPTPARKTRNT